MLEFELFGTTIRVKFLFIAVVTVLLLTDTSGLAVLYLVSCILHETGHILSFYAMKLTPSLLCFDITGIKLEQPKEQINFVTELFILLSGSMTNYMIALVGYLISPTQNANIIFINIAIGTFNLLPLTGFDGGKVLFVLLSCIFSDKLAYRICYILDNLTKIALICMFLFTIYAYEVELSYGLIVLLLIVSLYYIYLKKG